MWQRAGPRADIETLRDIVFRRALTVGLILAFPVVSVAVWHRASQGNFTMVVIDCLLYAIAIFVTTIANRHVQTLLISVVLWTLGTIVYINLGPRSEGLAPFLVLIAFLSVMYDRAVYVGGIVAALFGLCSAIAFRGYTAGRTPVEYLSAEPWTPWLSDFFQLGLFGAGLAYLISRLTKAFRDLYQSQATILENSSDYVMLVDLERRIIYVNRTLPELTKSMVLGRPLLEFLPERAHQTVIDCLDRVEASGLTGSYEVEYDYANGETGFFVANVNPLFQNGEVSSFVINAADMTNERRQNRERLDIELKMKDSQRLESLGLLAGGIAHDFNNLLAAILGNADMGRIKAADQPAIKKYFDTIADSSEKAADLCRRLLTYAGRGGEARKPIDLGELLLDLEPLMRSAAKGRADLIVTAGTGAATTMGDETQLRQVVLNLVTNAAESRESGPLSVRVSAGIQEYDAPAERWDYEQGTAPAAPCAFIQVEDTGTGIEKSLVSRIFEPFYTSKKSGHGLGLAAVTGIVLSHDGAIRVRSRMGEGTIFRVMFPAVDERLEPHEAAPETTSVAPSDFTILIVDDEESVRNVACEYLESLGCTTACAESGVAACDAIKDNHENIRIVLLDMIMPGMSGLETYRALKEIDPALEFIVSTGLAEAEDLKALANEGVEHFIYKPYTRDQLARQVAALGANGRA